MSKEKKQSSKKYASKSSSKKTMQKKSEQKKKSTSKAPKIPLKIISLGGLGEIGKNLTVYEYKNDILLVDCGMAFPDEETPGVDIVIPDFSYLVLNKEKIRGFFIVQYVHNKSGYYNILQNQCQRKAGYKAHRLSHHSPRAEGCCNRINNT